MTSLLPKPVDSSLLLSRCQSQKCEDGLRLIATSGVDLIYLAVGLNLPCNHSSPGEILNCLKTLEALGISITGSIPVIGFYADGNLANCMEILLPYSIFESRYIVMGYFFLGDLKEVRGTDKRNTMGRTYFIRFSKPSCFTSFLGKQD